MSTGGGILTIIRNVKGSVTIVMNSLPGCWSSPFSCSWIKRFQENKRIQKKNMIKY